MAAFNPRNISYFSPKMVNSTDMPGWSSKDHVFRDPWGNPYIITLDLDYDDHCVDTFYSRFTTHLGSYMIWSLGPDGQINTAAKVKDNENKDNVLSW
jgi:hypothetical protein